MRRFSLKLKVTIWYTLAMIVISAIVLSAMTSASHDMIHRDISSRLIKIVSDTSKMIIDRSGRIRPIPKFILYDQGVHMIVYDEEYNLLNEQQVPFGITDELDFSDNEIRKKTYNNNDYLVYDKKISTPFTQKSYWIKGIVSVSDEMYAVKSVFKTNLMLTLMLIIIAAVGGYFILKKAFVPVNKIMKTAKSISESSDLSRRINIGVGNDEIHDLANTFDLMLDRIEKTFEREKQFTSDASHELRTPVAVIMSECEYVAECAENLDDALESVESIKSQADKMSKLISELLTISRMDKNTLQANFESTDISELLSFVCEEQVNINNPDIILTQQIEPDISAEVDRFLLARLFINLISNAYKYCENNIQVSLTKNGNKIVFTVSDDGIGIEEKHIDKIWERFYQVDGARTSNENGSMGLGLSMVKWIAECHHGNVSVKSTPGKGAEFRFEVPDKF